MIPNSMATGRAVAPLEHYLPLHQACNMLAPPSWKFIVSLMALKHGVMQREILGPYRTKHITRARHEAMMLIYQHTQLGLVGVSRVFGRDHSSTHHALSKFGNVRKLVDKPERLPAAPYNRRAFIMTQRRSATGVFIPMDSPNA